MELLGNETQKYEMMSQGQLELRPQLQIFRSKYCTFLYIKYVSSDKVIVFRNSDFFFVTGHSTKPKLKYSESDNVNITPMNRIGTFFL